ncbi:hypothetical protein JCM5350_007282 [Sporobolomyces pararoseus]
MIRSLAVLFASFASLISAASEVGSPTLFQCSPAAIQYTCDGPPCNIIARPADDAASSLENFGSVNDASGTVSWKPVDQKAGTVVVLYITNADGEQATSARLTVNAPNDDSNTLGSDGKCGGSSSSSTASDDSASSSSSSSAASGTSSGAGASITSAVESASSKASDAAESASSKASSITSDLNSKTSSAGNSTPTASDSGSGATSVLVKSSVLAVAVIAVASALF